MPISLQPAARSATDTLGCQSSQLHLDQEFAGGGLRLYRKRAMSPMLGHVVMPAADRGVLVGLSLGAAHRRRIIHSNHASVHDFGRDAIYVRNFTDDYRADLIGPMDFMLLEMSRGLMDGIIDEEGGGRCDGLRPVAGIEDPVLGHLLHALRPALDRPHEASRLFVDHLAMATGLHLLSRYGSNKLPMPARRGGLSRAHEVRAKDMLRARLDRDVSVADVALACGLSRSHFIRAFRQSTGQTPHQWLQACRIEYARELLSISRQSLAEVATACGFADQSHFTRVFAQQMGMPPGQWRRHAATDLN